MGLVEWWGQLSTLRRVVYGGGGYCIVLGLAERYAYRMDTRYIEHLVPSGQPRHLYHQWSKGRDVSPRDDTWGPRMRRGHINGEETKVQ